MKFDEVIAKAKKELESPDNYNVNTPMFRGIGFALMALAIAIKEKNDGETNPSRQE